MILFMNNGNFYKEIIKQSPFGYFYGQLIKDNNGKVINFKILDINSKFENIVKLKEEDILGKRISDIFPSFINESFDWFSFFENIKLNGGSSTTEQFIKSFNGLFEVHVFSHKNDYFVMQLIEIHKEYEFMKVLIDSLPFAAWSKDKYGKYIYVNKKHEEEIGRTFDNIIGKTDFEVWPLDLARQFKEEDKETMTRGNIKNIYKFSLNNTWVQSYKVAVDDEEGNIIGTIGFSIDINEEKRIKSEIEQANKFLKVLINSIPDYVFYKDLNGTYLLINDSTAKEFHGKSEDQLIGKTDRELIDDREVVERFTCQDKEVAKEGKIKIYEESNKLKNGNVIDCEVIKAPVFDENNNVIGILGISRDITHRTIAEQKLKESEEKFRQLAENIDGVFLIREGRNMIYVSPGYEKIFGRSCESLYKDIESFGDTVHPEDKDRYINNKNGHIASKDWDKFLNSIENKDFDETFRIIRPDGEIRWILFRGVPIKGENENIIRKVGILQDITTIREAERELERLRTEFFANLSHEFRTPLNLIFSSLQLIELKLKGITCDNMINFARYTNIIRQNSFRLLRLVNNLIDTTKIDAGYAEYCSTNYDIVKYIKNICDSVAEFAKEKDIEIIFNSEIEEKIISFDLDKMERIILNLLSNAIKYNVLGGKIEVFISSSEEFIEIYVKDTGIGIQEDKLPYVFERFKQVHNRLTKVSEGSGIGLCLVKSLVEMHGGTIKVKSNLGEGTQFIVKLPNIIINEIKETMVNRNQIQSNSRVERIQIEFSDIYGLNI